MQHELTSSPWELPGAENEVILGDCHEPPVDVKPRGVVLMTHGFLGYKDYGMFPYLADSFARAGLITHRYNLSHSGMTNSVESFERPDLFERDTWNHQVEDIAAVMNAVDSGTLDGSGLPILLWGHSRGGVASLLTAGRRFRDRLLPLPAAVVTVSAPDSTNRMSEDAFATMLRVGHLEVTSNRTGQQLRINRRWAEEQLDDPSNHDLLGLSSQIRCPVLVIHGQDDPTVPADCADHLANAIKRGDGTAATMIIPHADHVFRTPNPMPADSKPSHELEAMKNACVDFFLRCTD